MTSSGFWLKQVCACGMADLPVGGIAQCSIHVQSAPGLKQIVAEPVVLRNGVYFEGDQTGLTGWSDRQIQCISPLFVTWLGDSEISAAK